jgi:pyrroline-5-carboxylate reductase
MIRDLRVAIIGAGAIGEAIIGGLLRQELVGAEQIIISHPRDDRRRELHARFDVATTADNAEAARWGQIVIVAVKPQMLQRVLPALHDTLNPGDLVISVVAGVTIHTFADALHHPNVVRSMPNTPAQIGAGMIVWTAAPEVSDAQHAWTRTVLGALGRELYVDNEQYLDMATALSGSGPAYFFLLMEAMIDAGVHLGLSRRIAEELVQQTMLGSVRYAQQSNLHPAQLRNAVTSPGGTSAAALSALERGGLRTVFADAIWAAYRRSIELGKSA